MSEQKRGRKTFNKVSVLRKKPIDFGCGHLIKNELKNVINFHYFAYNYTVHRKFDIRCPLDGSVFLGIGGR